MILLLAVGSFLPSGAYSQPRDIGWQDLVPLGWPDRDPLDGQDISQLTDDDPEAERLYSILRAYLDKAPVVSSLDNQLVVIPGFVVPLEFHPGSREIRRFLLVPFYGACIHVPPPASNQIILVDAATASGTFPQQPDAPVQVTGMLTIEHADTGLGVSSYRLNASRITLYR